LVISPLVCGVDPVMALGSESPPTLIYLKTVSINIRSDVYIIQLAVKGFQTARPPYKL
jgi:hypothetical protein